MAADDEIKIKGAAEQKQAQEQTGKSDAPPEEQHKQPAQPEPEQAAQGVETANVAQDQSESTNDGQQQQSTQQPEYKWCKIFFEAAPGAQNFYFLHFDTRDIKYEEPTEPYWIWDALTNNVHDCGLQQSSVLASTSASGVLATAQGGEAGAEYQGYNPKIHGSYDPNAPYAQFHNQKRAEEEGIQVHAIIDPAAAAQAGDYTAQGNFNRFTGAFQSDDKNPERHNDYNKSARQMSAFYDVDAAANTHGGKSLKEERRQQKLSKKEIKELTQKRREKKEKKRMDFYRS